MFFDAATLKAATALVVKGTDPKSPWPAYGSILIKANPSSNIATLSSASIAGSVTIMAPFQGHKTESLESLVNAFAFSRAVRAIPKDEGATVQVTQSGSTLRLWSDNYRTELPTMDPNSFPLARDFPVGEMAEMPSSVFLDLVRAVADTANSEEPRPAMRNISLVIEEDQVSATTSDGFMAKSASATIDQYASNRLHALIPQTFLTKVLVPVLRALDDCTLLFWMHDGHLKIEDDAGGVSITSLLTDAQWPEVAMLFSSITPVCTYTFAPENWTGAVSVCRAVGINVKITQVTDGLVLSTYAGEEGHASYTINDVGEGTGAEGEVILTLAADYMNKIKPTGSSLEMEYQAWNVPPIFSYDYGSVDVKALIMPMAV